MSSIELAAVSKRYDAVSAVADVTLAIEPGTFVTLLGPSGSGKTTTMRMIAGLEKPSTGTISIGGRIVSGNGVFVPTYRRRLGMVFQSYAVWPHKTVRENVAFPLKMLRVDRAEQHKRADSMLEKVGLDGYGERYPSQLSGGQQQRVSLARALVAEPQVILFDEPLSNLDAKLRDSMRELIHELHRAIGTTSIYVTHDQAEAMVLSDRIHIMHNGRLVQSGTPEDLYERPASRFVAEFIGAANTIKVAAVDRAAMGVKLREGSSLAVGRLDDRSSESILVVRPHQLRLVDAAASNVLPGTIRSASYLGDRRRYHIELATGEPVAVEVDSSDSRGCVGERVFVHFPPEHCVVI
ncbi:ABC transporter ATP-binding protein [Bosea sp. (in: a-proteobacteria)]|uniref:ABC transporter ATP-binding protein n=1 Tax=Bosea sp. (in: a-proteobacteria) TaxID=1871050 RepID=UPI00260750E9|nr:ABC transporter ATP-binding protein [Bosea sp. (in: a-proteobacteria)]MCO5089600.1 ABC transporter ATP-binding protein [Bosea sp. (in: a-proteobacteria)]